MFKQKIKKNIAVALAFLFVFSDLFYPIKSFAGIDLVHMYMDTSPASIARNISLNAITLSSGVTAVNTGVTAVNTTVVTQKETWLDSLGWMMANVVINQFGDAIVDWIKGGFNGNPMFLSDPEGFFRDTANQMSGAFISYANMGWLCNPLGKLNLSLNFFFPGTIRNKYKCTFNDVAGNFKNMSDRKDISDWITFNVSVTEKNITNVFGDDFRNGGFLMWFLAIDEQNHDIGNNDLGRTLSLGDDVFAAAQANVATEKFGLSLNGGFFGLKKCLEYIGKNCVKSVDTTPGNLVQDQLKDVAGADLSRLKVADEINEIIGALATTMVGWLLTGGNDGGGVLGYDKNADYSASNRNLSQSLNQNQQIVSRKLMISSQIEEIKGKEEPYRKTLENYADSLYGTKEKLGIVLAKLKCIRATSTNDINNIYPDSDCDGMDERIKNIKLSAVNKTLVDITTDIASTTDAIGKINGKIANFKNKYGENATSTSAQALKLFDEFEGKIMGADSLGKIVSIASGYCYSYNENNQTGKICGLFGEKSASDEMSVYISAENNPAVYNINTGTTTKISWKAVNAESCQATGGDSDTTWKNTVISTGGSYATTNFTDGKSRNYGLKCFDAENKTKTAGVSVSADSSSLKPLSGSLFAKSLFVKSGEASSLYWLSTNASQCYLYGASANTAINPINPFDYRANAEYITSTTTGWFQGAGYYLKTLLAKTTGQTTATFSAGETFQYKLICGDSNQAYSVLSNVEIASEDSAKETYQTHSETEYKALNKEALKIETEMENVALKFACLLNDYTQAEGVTSAECSVFE